MASRRYPRWQSALKVLAVATSLCWSLSQGSAAGDSDPKSADPAAETVAADAPPTAPPTAPGAPQGSPSAPRQDLNLLGVTDANSGESRRNGTPFSVISGSDSPGFGNVDGSRGDRPNVVDTSVLGTTLAHPDDRANLPRSAFAFITIDEASGSLGRNTFRKDGIRNINAALSKTWSVHSEKTLLLRAESINLFNTPQFAEPTNVLTSPSFGQITNTLNDGRTFQFLLRFSF